MKYEIKNVNDFNNDEINYFLNKCNLNQINYINKVKNKKRFKQTIVSRILLAKLLKEEFDINYFDMEINYNKNGKPFFKNSDIFFNISHSQDIVICAIGKNKIGVDVEKISNINKKILNYYTTPKEKEYIFSNDSDPNKNYVILHTVKEAYIKMNGHSFLKNNCMDFTLKNNNIVFNDKKINLKIIDNNNYIISICWKK